MPRNNNKRTIEIWDPCNCSHSSWSNSYTKERWSGQGRRQIVTRYTMIRCLQCGWEKIINSKQV